ncbi:XdhC family protein [Mucilaginibacter terrae]|uniref:Xanthine dehydrogenase accessory factor n=1 Tax=Mucilaginibacter terrae TaxID=1955052 RepID=A0ABU3GTL2_9SPHI|nr:XdhC/CoxI family protein [Mucilaginibacter terrae]MDT3403126.1 xanthine dehydrogenase accessory factor [Mucilaginibacter terrae]
MKELEDIVKAFDIAQQHGKQTALATVVQVEGSSYRRAGARMLVTEDGELTGAISGGCLEGDALRKARLAMAQQQPMLVTYDTTDDDDAKLGVGLGCNGIIHILIEPIFADDEHQPINLFKKILSKRQNAVVVTLFSLTNRKAAQPGTCLFLRGDEFFIQYDTPELTMQLQADAEAVLKASRSATHTYTTPNGNELTAFVELLKPAVSLLIFGAGNDAIPLAQMAAVLGWHVTIIDGRANYAVAGRFPSAPKMLLAKPQEALSQLSIDENTVVVLMTHNYNYDLAMLRQLLPLQLTYVGSLGPKKKLERMLDELQQEGMTITPNQLQSIYGPTGLDIGAQTPEEISLSILSEIQAVLQQREGKSLRNKTTVIHVHEMDALPVNHENL